MSWVLTIYICSLATGECIQPKLEDWGFEKNHASHYDCVRSGLGDSFELLFDGKTFKQDQIEQYELYPKFSCIPEEIFKEDT
jgi:hypothetical protein